MNIAVCLKPVPDPRHYGKLTINPETKLLERGVAPMVINPADRHAVETALRLKEQHGGKVVLVSMAPPEAGTTLKEGLAMGADEAYLLSDRAFAGSDTLATARVLTAGLKKIGSFDLILAGSASADSGTSHMPSQLGELLGLPHLNCLIDLSLESSVLKMKAKTEYGYVEYEGCLPMVLGVAREINKPRYISLMGIVAAGNKPLITWGLHDLGLSPDDAGLAGSPTRPGELHRPEHRRKVQMLEGGAGDAAVEILAILRAAGVLS